MKKLSQITRRHVFITVLLAIAMVFSYLAGTISVEARLFMQDETRATNSQIAAVSAAVSLLLLGDEDGVTVFLPLIVR